MKPQEHVVSVVIVSLCLLQIILFSTGCGSSDPGKPTAKNPFVIKTVEYGPSREEPTIKLLVHESMVDTEITDIAVKIGDMELAPQFFDFRKRKNKGDDSFILLFCYPTQPGVSRPDEALFPTTKVRVNGIWYEYKKGT